MNTLLIRIFAVVNVLLIGYLFFTFNHSKQPERSTMEPMAAQPASTDPGPMIDVALDRQANDDARLKALAQLRAATLTDPQLEQLHEAFYQTQAEAGALDTLALRDRVGTLLIQNGYAPAAFAEGLREIVLDQTIPLPLRNQALIQSYRLIDHQLSSGSPVEAWALALEALTRGLAAQRPQALTRTMLEGEAYLRRKHPDFMSPVELEQRILRALRNLQADEAVLQTALRLSAQWGLAEARVDAERLAQEGESQAIQLAALEAAAALGSEQAFFTTLSYSDVTLELARLKALQQLGGSGGEQ